MSDNTNRNDDVNGAGTSCEGPSSGRCPTGEQRGPGRQSSTANNGKTKRRKWTQNDNRIVMECYFKSDPSIIGYIERMYAIWKSMEMFEVSEQRLMDQNRQIEIMAY